MKIGLDAIKSAEGERDSFLRYVGKEESIVVRMLAETEVAEVLTHGVYQVFNTVGHTEDNYYDKAAAVIFDEANKLKEELEKMPKGTEAFKKAEENWKTVIKRAYALQAEPQYLFAFVELSTGNLIAVPSSKKQAPATFNKIKKYQSQKDTFAFEVTKATGGFDVSPILEPLTTEQQAIFDKTKELKVPVDMFDKAYFKPSPEQQLEHLKAFGFDISKIVEVPAMEEGAPLDISDEDLPF
ncbi:hypothetical protein CON64_18620 [Bacillus pseudomycoides]|nr:hypothetical protein CON64_18620 [Bacillus pseudomycoides]